MRASERACQLAQRAQTNLYPPALPAVVVWWDSTTNSVQFGLGGAASSRTFAYVMSTSQIGGGGNSDPHLQVRRAQAIDTRV